ncbi:MAG: STAS domain-containing protein [Candidatus Binatia bacterium]
MAVQQGNIRVYQHDRTVTFQVEGKATMHLSPAVRRYAEQSLSAGPTVLSVDLRHCIHMDSTFLGTLLFLKRLVERREESSFALLSPSPRCRQLLQEMGMEKIFVIEDVEELPPDIWTELESGSENVTAFKRNVVQAHQELGRLDGPAGETFRALATEMAAELDAENQQDQKGQK